MGSKLYFAVIILLNFNYSLINAKGSASMEIDVTCIDDSECVLYFQTAETTSQCYSQECKCFDKRNTTVACKPVGIKNKKNFIGGPCPCTSENAVCNSKSERCECDPEYVSSDDGKSCIEIVQNYTESGECDNDTMCVERYGDSYCVFETKMCACFANYTLLDNRCVPFVGSPEQCEKNEDCTNHRNHTVCVIDTKSCVCDDGYIFVNSTTECLPKSSYGHKCSDSQDCRTASNSEICQNGTCVCGPKYYELSSKDKIVQCIKKVYIGDSCTINADCFEANRHSQVMECLNGECLCRPKYKKTNENRCESSGVGIIGTNLTLLIVLSNLLFIYKITIFSN